MIFMRRFDNSYRKYVLGLEQINEAALQCPQDFILGIEEAYHKEIANVVDHVLSPKSKCKVIMLSGPSGSGKTTTAHMIRDEIKARGVGSVIISLDDFYLGRDKIPVFEDGSPNFETVEALNVEEIKRCISSLMNEGSCDIPQFSFEKQRPEDEKEHIELNPGDVAIIEGIHGLNPIFTNQLPQEGILKIYISVKQGIQDYNGTVIQNRSIRLARRLTRDFDKRKSHPEETLTMWDDVCKGQSMYIYPFKRTSDMTINSLHIYELCVLRSIAVPLLKKVKEDSPVFKDALKLISTLERFYPIDANLVPKTSMIREFIGGGIY